MTVSELIDRLKNDFKPDQKIYSWSPKMGKFYPIEDVYPDFNEDTNEDIVSI